MNPEQIVRRFCEAAEQRDSAALAAFFTDDAVYHNIPIDPVQGPEAIRKMLHATTRLGRELAGVVRDNQRQLAPALAKLDRVAAMLRRNQQHLGDALAVLGPYYRMLTAAMGNGRWVDAYVCGLFDANAAPVLDNDVVRDCRPGGAS